MLFINSFNELWNCNTDNGQYVRLSVDNSMNDINSKIHACSDDWTILQSLRQALNKADSSEDDLQVYKDTVSDLKAKTRDIKKSIYEEFGELATRVYLHEGFNGALYRDMNSLISKIDELKRTGFGNKAVLQEDAISSDDSIDELKSLLDKLYVTYFDLEGKGGLGDTGNNQRQVSKDSEVKWMEFNPDEIKNYLGIMDALVQKILGLSVDDYNTTSFEDEFEKLKQKKQRERDIFEEEIKYVDEFEDMPTSDGYWKQMKKGVDKAIQEVLKSEERERRIKEEEKRKFYIPEEEIEKSTLSEELARLEEKKTRRKKGEPIKKSDDVTDKNKRKFSSESLERIREALDELPKTENDYTLIRYLSDDELERVILSLLGERYA